MKSKLLLIVLFSGLGLATQAQSNTRGISSDTSARALANATDNNTPAHKILLIPFFPKMCMSEIGKDVHAATNLSYDQIVQEFRRQLDLAMYTTLRKKYIAISILQGTDKSDSVLGYIYSNTGYKYDVVPGTVTDIGAKDNKGNKTSYIKNGQLQVPVDYSKRFMNATVNDVHMLANLSKKYNTDTYVFINELDIKNVTNPTQDLTADTYRREVTVHYTILDKDGKSIAKGIATTYFPYKENDPKVIGPKYFTAIAHAILKDYAQGLTINNLSDQQKKQAMQGSSTVTPK